MALVNFTPTPKIFNAYSAERFEAAVRDALVVTARVLGTARSPVLPSDAPHTYDDKFLLAEAQLSAGAVCALTVLQTIGLTAEQLVTLSTWARGGSSVTLRFAPEISGAFLREAQRDVEGPKTVETTQSTSVSSRLGLGASATQKTVSAKNASGPLSALPIGQALLQTKVVTTVTDYFWTLSAKWSVSAYRGTGRAAADVVQLCERHSASVTVKTTGQKSQPFAHVLGARAPSEVNLDWLLSVIDADAPGLPARVRINRSLPTCATPRRNVDADRALAWAAGFYAFLASFEEIVAGTLVSIADAAGAETHTTIDRGVFGSGSVFVPALLFCSPAAPAASGSAVVPAASDSEAPPAPQQLMDLASVNALVGEAAAGVRGRVDAARSRLPPADTAAMLSVAEAALVVAGRFGRAAMEHLANGWVERVWRVAGVCGLLGCGWGGATLERSRALAAYPPHSLSRTPVCAHTAAQARLD